MFNYYYYTNSYYMLGNILVLVCVALMALAQMKVSSAYNKYSKGCVGVKPVPKKDITK